MSITHPSLNLNMRGTNLTTCFSSSKSVKMSNYASINLTDMRGTKLNKPIYFSSSEQRCPLRIHHLNITRKNLTSVYILILVSKDVHYESINHNMPGTKLDKRIYDSSSEQRCPLQIHQSQHETRNKA